MFPKYLLSEQFWTDDQLKEYWTQDLQKSFEHNIRVFEYAYVSVLKLQLENSFKCLYLMCNLTPESCQSIN